MTPNKHNAGPTNRDMTTPSAGTDDAKDQLVQMAMANEKNAAPTDTNTPAMVFHIEIVLTSFSKIA